MNRRNKRATMANRVVFVGCQFCGAVHLPLRNYEGGKICPNCMKYRNVSKSDTGKERRHG